MSEQTGRQEGLGKTGGLPGHHADPRTRELPEDQRDDTVAMGDVAPAADTDTDTGAGEEADTDPRS